MKTKIQDNQNKLIEYGALHLGSGVNNLKAIRGGGGKVNVTFSSPNQRYNSLEA